MTAPPFVRTLDPADAHPLYLRCLAWRLEGLRIAAALSKMGKQSRAKALTAAVDAAALAVGDAIPRLREDAE